jgi:8-oxo-dGTP diphosphatase
VHLDLPQRLTAFTCTLHEGRMLLVRHVRLGVVRWELPGGHIEPSEPVADAAVRETREETGVDVTPGGVVAEARHTWRGRTVGIVYLRATPRTGTPTGAAPLADPRIRDIAWVDPTDLDPAETSPLALPVIEHAVARAGAHPCFTATHHRTAAGWEPVVTRHWVQEGPCDAPVRATSYDVAAGATGAHDLRREVVRPGGFDDRLV